jgi:hypothetical protein
MAQGRKRPDAVYPTPPNNPRALDYWKWLSAVGVPMVAAPHHWFENGGHNVPHTCWGVCAPDGDFRFVQDMTDVEETDATVTTPPNAGAQGNEVPPWRNTLRYGPVGTAQYWEGWLTHGDWAAA